MTDDGEPPRLPLAGLGKKPTEPGASEPLEGSTNCHDPSVSPAESKSKSDG